MRALLQHLAQWLLAYGPVGVFLIAAIDSVGVPLPAAMDVLVIGVAADAVRSPQFAWITALVAVLGSIGGNILLYLGARHGRRLFGKRPPAETSPPRLQVWFHRYGLFTVFIPAVVPFIPLPLKVFVISAGALHTPFVRFLAVILVARVIRFFGEAWLGLQLGRDAQGFLIRNGWTIAGVFLALSFAMVLLIRLAARPAREAGGRV